MAEVESHFAEQRSEVVVSSSTYTTAHSLTFTPAADTEYLLLYSALRFTNRSDPIAFTDGGGNRLIASSSSVTDYWGSDLWAETFDFGASPSSQTYEMQARRQDAGQAQLLRDQRILALALGDDDLVAKDDTASSTNSTSFQDKLSLNVNTDGDYLVIACAQHENDSPGSDMATGEVRLTDGTNHWATGRRVQGGTFAGSFWCAIRRMSITGSTTLKVQWRSTDGSGDDILCERARIIAINLNRFANNYYSEDATEESTTASTLQDATGALTATPAATRNHLILGQSILQKDTGGRVYREVAQDAGDVLEEQFADIDTEAVADNTFQAAFVQRASLADSQTTWTHRWRSDGTGTAYIRDKSLIVIDLEETSTGESVTLTGTLTATSTTAGALALQMDLLSTLQAQSTAQGTIDLQPALSGQASGQSTLTGAVDAQPGLSGSITGTSTLSGALSLLGEMLLSGAIEGVSSTQGSLSLLMELGGAVTGESQASGAVSVLQGLQGQINATSTASGALSTLGQMLLSGTVVGVSDTSGRLVVDQGLQGEVEASSDLLGAAYMELALSGQMDAASDFSGLLSGVGARYLKAESVALKPALDAKPELRAALEAAVKLNSH